MISGTDEKHKHWDKYFMLFSRTCHHCNILKQHLLPWETLTDLCRCCGWINTEMTLLCIFNSSPPICTTSISPLAFLPLCDTHIPIRGFVIYQTPGPDVPPLLLSYLELWKHRCQRLEWDKGGLLSAVAALAHCLFLKTRQVSFALGQRQ